MNTADDSITIRLSRDQAVVLSDFFGRFEQSNKFQLRSNAEFIAFSEIAGQLDTALVEPFLPSYSAIVEAARLRLSQDFEGLAPGVVSGDD